MSVVLNADGAEMTVVHKNAELVWGAWNVTLRDGDESQDPEQVQNAFVYRPTSGRIPKGERLWVRADCSQDMNKGESDTELVLDTAERVSDGEVVFEREISPVGLAGFRYGEDFSAGDFVDVRVWGRKVRVPVAGKTDSVAGTSVNVGGVSVANLVDLRLKNNDIIRMINDERRESGLSLIELEGSIKGYVDSQDESVRSDATDYADVMALGAVEMASQDATSKANTAKGEAVSTANTNAENKVKPVRDQSNTMNGDMSTALSEMARLLGVSAAGVAEGQRLTKVTQELAKKANSVAGDLASHVSKYDELVKDYTAKIGTAGTLTKQVEGAVSNLNSITSNGKWTGSDFNKTVQFAVDALGVFANEQVATNKGFVDLFAAQDLINQQQSVLNGKNLTFQQFVNGFISTQSTVNDNQSRWNQATTSVLNNQSAWNTAKDRTDAWQTALVNKNTTALEVVTEALEGHGKAIKSLQYAEILQRAYAPQQMNFWFDIEKATRKVTPRSATLNARGADLFDLNSAQFASRRQGNVYCLFIPLKSESLSLFAGSALLQTDSGMEVSPPLLINDPTADKPGRRSLQFTYSKAVFESAESAFYIAPQLIYFPTEISPEFQKEIDALNL